MLNIKTNSNLRVIRKDEDKMYDIYKKLLKLLLHTKFRAIIKNTNIYLFHIHIDRYLFIKV